MTVDLVFIGVDNALEPAAHGDQRSPARLSSMGEAASSTTLVPVNGNGLDTSFRDVILPLSRHELVLSIAKSVVLHNTQTQELSFVTGPQEQSSRPLGEITAMALCGKRQHLSVCRAAVKADENSANSLASISVYSVTARADRPDPATTTGKGASTRRLVLLKTLVVTWTDRFVGTALSPDGKLVSAQGANSSWSLGVWDWGRGRQVALSDVHCRVTRVRFNAIDMAQLSTSGGNLLRIWTLCAYTLKPLASFKSGDETKVKSVVSYADHAWLPGDVLVGLLEDGDVQLVVNAELVQTLRAVHKGLGRLLCMSPLNNGEGVVVGGTHGLVSVVRVASKMLKANEKELHLQRRMRVPNTERIVSVTTDPAAATLLCCTERGYGAYDLSNLCLLRGDDETIALSFLSSTPLSQHMERLSAASRRPCFAAACRLPDGDAAVHVWSQTDCHECFIAHPLEQQTPLSVDVHPAGSELLVTFSSKLQIFFVLQDSLRLGFEMPQKQLSLAQYSPSGGLFAAVHATNKAVFVYRGLSRVQREPQLVGVFRDFRDTVELFRWAVHDSSFFAVDAAGELRHCQLRWQSGGDAEDLIGTHSIAQTLSPDNVVVAFTSSGMDHESHDYAVFVAEKRVTNASKRASSSRKCLVRAWVNGDLAVDALRSSSGGNAGESVPFEVTSLEAGPGLGANAGSDGNVYPNLLFAGTANGSVVIFSWKRGPRSCEGHSTILLSRAMRRVYLHTAPVVGLFYAARSRLLLSNTKNGVVLACKLCRENGGVGGDGESSAAMATAIRDEQNLRDLSTNAFTSICQPEELAVYDRSKVELSRLKLLDLDGELQQFKMENEMLSRQVSEQRTRFENSLQGELAAHSRAAQEELKALRIELDVRLGGAIHERERKLRSLSEDARSAQDHYLSTVEKLQTECDSLREQLHATKLDLQDEQRRAQEREVQLEYEGRKKLREAKVNYDATQQTLSEELEVTQRKLQEVLRQQDQDQLVHMGLLASTIDSEKQKGATQLAAQNGRAAALNQEVKMLLGALNHKDGELQQMCCDYDERVHELETLRDKLADERALTKRVLREKEESAAQLAEQRRVFENLQRLDGVHRSQLELLQKHIVPKDHELAHMQEHLNQLHEANQEVVVQANISDRLRVETSSLARKHERELETALKRLERVRHSIVVLQEELGELVQRSAAQEKSTLVTEIGRLHKRMTRQLDALQARGDSAAEVNAELHRQNRFLLQNKHSLRRQVEAGNREKHKLAAALSYQNASLVTELNTFRKANKELERRLSRHEELGAKGAGSTPSAVSETPSLNPEDEVPTEVDGRKLVLPTHAAERQSSSKTQFLTGRREPPPRAKPRPKSAAAGRRKPLIF
ncbi:Cilia- and flagella-associated protein 57 [Phytophthora pseudosyringae]|uniref:Cilia- and flagella-associated protein 57 n=1 Tax=Phytophthora pseudosyringae TaxID=221518 RepID=A0A8T1W380_9STRA|nr:Cilia- and flagella-associated protein 57 [Phytophthora pseudosyringae]